MPSLPTNALGACTLGGKLVLQPLIAMITLIVFSSAAGQQSTATQADPPLVAVHYQDILATEPPIIDLFIPPPNVAWSEFDYSAADCLRAEGVHTGPPDKVIIIRFAVPELGTCSTRVDLLFGDETSTWAASALVVVNRLPDLPAVHDLAPKFSRHQLPLPATGPHDRPADLILLGLHNPRDVPLTVLGFGNDEAFIATVGRLYQYEPAVLQGRYSDLITSGSPFQPTEVAPGSNADFALVVAAGQSLPTYAGTVTVRPVALVQMAGERYTLQFPRVSAAWGVDLP